MWHFRLKKRQKEENKEKNVFKQVHFFPNIGKFMELSSENRKQVIEELTN